jgi:hypothetical protein
MLLLLFEINFFWNQFCPPKIVLPNMAVVTVVVLKVIAPLSFLVIPF